MFLFFSALHASAQHRSSGNGLYLVFRGNTDSIERIITSAKYSIPLEGGAYIPVVDTATPLNELILKLNDRWELIPTYKLYWIGYTDLMFSIAAHGDDAISALVNFADSSENQDACLAALYTLHLIGIDKHVASRFKEDFKNEQARKALLHLLKHERLRPFIMELLIRDRWKSDIPAYMEILKSYQGEMWPIVNACISDIPEIPLHQEIPKRFNSVMLKVIDKDSSLFDFNIDYSGQAIEALNEIKGKPHIHIDTALFDSKLWDKHQKISQREPFSLSSFLYRMTGGGYISNGSQLQYYVKNGDLYICASHQAKEIILDWWMQQSDTLKASFVNSHESFRYTSF